jgi:hypothetical protein
LAPQFVQLPPKQTWFPVEQALSAPTHLFAFESQQSPEVVHPLPAQQGPPVVPHGVHVPPLQRLATPASVVVHAMALSTHLVVTGSQQPPVHGVAPAQHARPLLPQGAASGAESTGPSDAPSVPVPPSLPVSAVASGPPLEEPSAVASPPLEDALPLLDDEASPFASDVVPSCDDPSPLPLLLPLEPEVPSGTVPSPFPPSAPGVVSKTLKSLVHAAKATAARATREAMRRDFIVSLSGRGKKARSRAPSSPRASTSSPD